MSFLINARKSIKQPSITPSKILDWNDNEEAAPDFEGGSSDMASVGDEDIGGSAGNVSDVEVVGLDDILLALEVWLSVSLIPLLPPPSPTCIHRSLMGAAVVIVLAATGAIAGAVIAIADGDND
jgi:hypothetical protein